MQINKNNILKLAKGTIELSDLNTPFIIMRSRVTMRFHNDDYGYEYHVVHSNNINVDDGLADEIPIEKKTAKTLIERLAMVQAHTTKDGTIYELPGEPFKARYAGKGLVRANKKKMPFIDRNEIEEMLCEYYDFSNVTEEQWDNIDRKIEDECKVRGLSPNENYDLYALVCDSAVGKILN